MDRVVMLQVSVRDSRSIKADCQWIQGVFRQYLNDLAPAATGLFPALGEVGHREPDQVSRWFADPTAHVITVYYGEARVGFALVRTLRAPPAAPVSFTMSEFFIAQDWRRRGIGAQAVRLILDRFNGQWLITETLSNQSAVNFWRDTVSGYTQGRYVERIVNGEVQQRFESRLARRGA